MTGTPGQSAWISQPESGNPYEPNLLYASSADHSLSQGTLGLAGSGQPHLNQQPYLALQYCIAFQGLFPRFQ